jgi:hypothetical protein
MSGAAYHKFVASAEDPEECAGCGHEERKHDEGRCTSCLME